MTALLGLSFASPELLLALLVVPLLVLGYVALMRRRGRAVSAFADPRLMPSVAPVTPGWRRHVPMTLALVSLAVLLVALARPQATVAVDVERAAVMLVTDRSGSMEATDVRPTRLAAARSSALNFLDDVPRGVRVGLVAFNQIARVVQSPTPDRAETRAAVRSLTPAGGTATGEAIATALGSLRRTERGVRASGRAPAAIVLLSDGASTRGRDPLEAAADAKKSGIPIYAVTVGTDRGTIEVENKGRTERRRVPPDRPTLRRVAQVSGGQYFNASDAAELKVVYDRLGSRLGSRDEPREITAAFAAGAIALLAAAGLLSMHWFARPI